LCPLWSSLAARTTAAGAAPLTLNTATSDPFDRRSSIRSASLPSRYPGGRGSWLVPCAAHAVSFVIFCPSTAIASMSWTALPTHPIHHLVLDLGPAALRRLMRNCGRQRRSRNLMLLVANLPSKVVPHRGSRLLLLVSLYVSVDHWWKAAHPSNPPKPGRPLSLSHSAR
jgi:hypothetical protein